MDSLIQAGLAALEALVLVHALLAGVLLAALALIIACITARHALQRAAVDPAPRAGRRLRESAGARIPHSAH